MLGIVFCAPKKFGRNSSGHWRNCRLDVIGFGPLVTMLAWSSYICFSVEGGRARDQKALEIAPAAQIPEAAFWSRARPAFHRKANV